MPSTTLSPDGYFQRDGRRFVPIGVNYWPGSTGVEMWPRWPEEEIQRDLDLIVSLGLNCIRFFLRWQDFEPEPGHYDPVTFARLAQFLTWCRERDLVAHPALFVGWMSGGVFWPRWKEGRNLFADPTMVERSVAFARQAARAIAPFDDIILALDQGNELCCLPDSPEAPPQAVAAWCEAVDEAIRSAYLQALIISGNEQNQIVSDVGWRFGRQPGTDLYSMHGYPVPTWHPLASDGMTDPLCQSLLPFYTRVARTFGPVLVQEFGTIATFGARQQDSYLRAILPACWEAGANGFLWWCLRDITAPVRPYLTNGFEGTLGLVDGEGRVKPGLEYYLEFARSLSARPAPAQEAGIGLYWPRHYYLRAEPENPGNNPHDLSRRLILANYLLRRLGEGVRIVRGDLPLDAGLDTLVIPGALLAVDEAEALAAWVEQGHHLLWHGPDPVNWGPAYIRLLGAEPVDYRAGRPVTVSLAGQAWTLASYPRGYRVQPAPVSAEVLATGEDGLPVVLRNRLGSGRVTYALPLVEDAIADVSDRPGERDRWQAWYEQLLHV